MDIISLKKKIVELRQQLDILKKKLELALQKQKEETIALITRIAKEEGVNEKELLAVIKCESGLNTKAVNVNKDGTIDYGLCQYNSYWYIERGKFLTKEEALNDTEKCIRIMCQQWKKGRARDWVCYLTGAYKKFL